MPDSGSEDPSDEELAGENSDDSDGEADLPQVCFQELSERHDCETNRFVFHLRYLT